jgi:DivIVA domain-containing protein
VALDRQSIEKKDFPVGRRGYDPAAVDAHLASLAEEVAEQQRNARRRSDTLASAASEQVRAIVEAAEASAEQITSDAEHEAREIRSEATGEAQATRDDATRQAREYVGKVSESTNTMLQRLDSMEQELSSLVESLRSGSNRLNSDLQLLEKDLSGVSDSVMPGRPMFEPDQGEAEVESEEQMTYSPEPAPPAEAAEFESVAGELDTFETVEEPSAPMEETFESADVTQSFGDTLAEPEVAVAGDTGATGDSEGDDDAEGARLIALNMALNGTPREETQRYLSENFQLSDTGGLLDEVYASVEG